MQKALQLANDPVLTQAHGARTGSKNVTTIIIIITDGVPTDTTPDGSPPTAAVKALIDGKDAQIFAVGVGSILPDSYLFELTGNHVNSDGKPDRVFQLNNFTELNKILQNLIRATACISSHGGSESGNNLKLT